MNHNIPPPAPVKLPKDRTDDPLEKTIETKVCNYAKRCGFYCRKYVSPNNRGVPDRFFISPAKIPFYIEFKKKGQKPTKLQAEQMRELERFGQPVHVVDDIDQGYRVIDTYNIQL